MGGAISDLVSRVYSLENLAQRSPDWKSRQELFSATFTKDNPIIPDYVTGTDARRVVATIPNNGWLYIRSLMENSSANEYQVVRIYVASAGVCVNACNGGKQSENDVFVPVCAGDQITLGINATDKGIANPSKMWVSFIFVGFKQ